MVAAVSCELEEKIKRNFDKLLEDAISNKKSLKDISYEIVIKSEIVNSINSGNIPDTLLCEIINYEDPLDQLFYLFMKDDCYNIHCEIDEFLRSLRYRVVI